MEDRAVVRSSSELPAVGAGIWNPSGPLQEQPELFLSSACEQLYILNLLLS